MTFEELGPLLRAEREKKGLSVDDVALHLKIGGRIIRALEDGDEESLPHNVYVRGFVRSYAGFLGFNDEELNSAMEAVNFDETPTAPQAVYTPIDGNPLSRKKIFVALLALCIVAAGGYWYVQDSELFSGGISTAVVMSTAKPAPPLNPPPATTDNADKNVATAPATGTAAQVGAVTPTPPATKAPATAPAIAPAVPPASRSTTPLTPVPSPTTATPQAVPPVTSPMVTTPATTMSAQQDTHKIIITALAECWIHSNADNTDTRQFSLRKGDTFALTFSKKLTLKLGNAGGVRIRYDGEDLPAPGTDGQVRTIVFPLEQ